MYHFLWLQYSYYGLGIPKCMSSLKLQVPGKNSLQQSKLQQKRKKMLRVFIISTVLSDTDNLQLLETVITLCSKKKGGLGKKMLKKAERRGSKEEGAASF